MGFYGNRTSKCLGTVALLVLYRGSGQEVGRSCHILEFKGKKVMVCIVKMYSSLCSRLLEVIWKKEWGVQKRHARGLGVPAQDAFENIIVSHRLSGRHSLLLHVTPSRTPFILVSITSKHLLYRLLSFFYKPTFPGVSALWSKHARVTDWCRIN